LHVTLLTPVQVIAKVDVCNVLTEVLKNHGLIVTVFADVRVLFMELGMLDQKHVGRETFLAHSTHV
jgi:hypothetical protein